jgi:UDP-glucose 4-epimerase
VTSVAVTGASGYLGSLFCKHLEGLGGTRKVQVIRLSKKSGLVLPVSIPPVNADYCVHFAAVTPPCSDRKRFFQVNSEGTRALLESLVENSPGLKRFVYISTGRVYGYGPKPSSEGDEPKPLDDYEKSKLEGERIAAEFSRKIPVTIIRLFYPYGRDAAGKKLVERLARKIARGEKIALNKGGSPKINPIHVDDFNRLAAEILFADDGRLKVYNVAGSDVVSIKELCEAIGGALGKKPVFEDSGFGKPVPNELGDPRKAVARF